MQGPLDQHARPLRSLRLSVTDRCNLRCRYCMPEEHYVWLPKDDLLSFEELTRLTQAFAALGADKVRLTGGEPLVRRGLGDLVAMLGDVPGIGDVALTTNGVLLEAQAEELAAAGLKRATVSLDSMRPERFSRMTQRDALPKVLAGIRAASRAGFEALKLNTVVVRGSNDDELADLIRFGQEVSAEVRFIEYMDVGGATRWNREAVVSVEEILARLTDAFGPIEPEAATAAPARRYRLSDGTRFGVIASTTAPFCSRCDRCRVTADGVLYLCLYAQDGLDLRGPLRDGASHEDLVALIRSTWEARSDRGAEQRLRLAGTRMPLASKGELEGNPHLEMHTRGG